MRGGTNPTVEDLPDLAPERLPPGADESESDLWLREQRPPHWE